MPTNAGNISRLWPHIHCLVVLLEQGSFTAAAKRLAISKATVSQRITELEQAAGVPLVRRTTRSMHLTEAGRRMVEETRGAYEHIANSFFEISDLTDLPRGLLRVTAPVALSRQHLIPLLPGFLKQNPQIRVEIDLNDELVSLATDGFDLALRHVDTPPDAYVAKSVSRTRTVLVASPAFVDAVPPLTHPSQLEPLRHLLYPRSLRNSSWAFEYIGRKRSSERHANVPVRAVFGANNSEVLREMAISGAGIALLPDFSAQKAIRNGTLVEILPDWRPVGTFGRRIYLLRPYSAHVPRPIKAFWNYLLREFPGRFEK